MVYTCSQSFKSVRFSGFGFTWWAGTAQVEMAALSHRASRLVRGTSASTGRREGFGAGEGGVTEVVSARCARHTRACHAIV